MSNKVGGILFLKIDGQQFRVKGTWTYNLGEPKREAVVGADGVHGFKEIPQVPFFEGAITDRSELNMTKLLNIVDATAILELNNGKIISYADCFFAGEGNVTTEEGEIAARFESIQKGQEIRA